MSNTSPTTPTAPTVEAPAVEAPAAPAAAATPVVKAKRVARRPHPWLAHVSKFRTDNADRIKNDKLSCADVSREAKASYRSKPKCATCGK